MVSLDSTPSPPNKTNTAAADTDSESRAAISPHAQTTGDPFMQLVFAAQQGNQEALGNLIEQCRDYLLLIANEDLSPELHGKFGASDFVQETMLIAHQKFPQFRGQTAAELKGWLRQILRNDLLRARRQFVTSKSRDVWREQRIDDSQRPGSPLRAGDDTPGTAALAAEEARILNEAMAKLPDNYRQAIWLREWQDHNYAEIGRQLSVSEEAARKLCRRALDKLEQLLKPHWLESDSNNQSAEDRSHDDPRSPE